MYICPLRRHFLLKRKISLRVPYGSSYSKDTLRFTLEVFSAESWHLTWHITISRISTSLNTVGTILPVSQKLVVTILRYFTFSQGGTISGIRFPCTLLIHDKHMERGGHYWTSLIHNCDNIKCL